MAVLRGVHEEQKFVDQFGLIGLPADPKKARVVADKCGLKAEELRMS